MSQPILVQFILRLNPLNVLNHYDLKRDDLLLERGGFHLFIYLFTLYIIISL